MFKLFFTYIWPFTWLNRQFEAIDKAWADRGYND